MAATQIVPGAVLWRLLRRDQGTWVEDLALGGGLALVVSGLLGALGGYLGAPWLPLLLAATVLLLLLVPPVRRAWRATPTAALPPPGWIASVAATGAAFLTVYADYALANPVVWSGWMRHFIDGPYHLALAGEVLHHGPEQFAWVAGTPMRYPWLLYGWDASFAHLPGLPLDVALFRATPVILLTLLPFAMAAATWRLAGRAWAGPVGALLALAAGSLALGTEPATSPVVLNSPPQQLGLVVLACAVALLALRWRGSSRAWSWVALVILLVGLFLAKGGPFPVLVAGMGLAAAVWVVLSRARAQRVVLLDLALALLVLAFGFVVLLGGSASDLTLDPLAGMVRILTGDRATVVAGSTLAAATVAFAFSRLAGTTAGLLLLEGDRRTDLVRWVVLAGPVAGIGAALLLFQSGMSQQYFLVAGAVVGSLGAAWGIAQTWDRSGGPRLVAIGALAGVLAWAVQYGVARRTAHQPGFDLHAQRWAMFMGLVLLVACLVLAVALVRPGRPWAGDLARGLAIAVTVAAVASVVPRVVAPDRLVVNPAAPGSLSAWSRANVAAATYLQGVSQPSDVVMTNRHCNSLPLPDCDRRAFVISAYSERRVLVEGWAYTPGGDRRRRGRDTADVAVRRAVLGPRSTGPQRPVPHHPHSGRRQALWDEGVRWAYVDRVAGRTGDLSPYAVQVFANEEATVYRLLDPAR